MNDAKTKSWWGRNWKWLVPSGCLSIIGVIVIGIGLLVTLIFGVIKSADAYKIALEKAKASSAVVNAIGSPVKEGFFVAGSVNVTDSSGNADLAIPVSGPKGKGTITAVANKSDGKWIFSRLQFQAESGGEAIDLLKE